MDNQDKLELSPEGRRASQGTAQICPRCGQSRPIEAMECPGCRATLSMGDAGSQAGPVFYKNRRIKQGLAVGGFLALLIGVGIPAANILEHRQIEAEGRRMMALAEEGRRQAAEAEARKTPEQRAAEQAAKQAEQAAALAIRDKARAEADKAAKARNQCEALFSDLRMAMARSSLVASEMAEQNTLNSYFRRRDRELVQSLQASREGTSRVAHIYAGMSPTIQDSPLGEAIYNAQEYCEYSAKAAKAWMAYFKTLDAEDRDHAKLAIRQAHEAENDFNVKSRSILQALQ